MLCRVKTEVPESPGVYIMKNAADEIIYIGKAKVLRRRMKSYFDPTPKTTKTLALVKNIDHFDYILTNSELDAFSLECNLIKEHKPKYNILLKDDKSFPYIKIDLNEKYPRVQVARRPKPSPNVLLFGPYVTGTRIGELMSLIKSAYAVRWCNKNFDDRPLARPCVHGEIGNCAAPCLGGERAERYGKIIDNVIDFLNGKTGDIKRELRQKMDTAAKDMRFEDAIKYRNELSSVQNMEKNLITSLDVGSNLDVFGVAVLDGVYAVCTMIIRSGKNVGQFSTALGEAVGDTDEVLMQYIFNFYTASSVPAKEVVLRISEDKREILQEFFLNKFGRVIRITVPKIAVKRQLVENCERNANEFLSHSAIRLEKKRLMTTDAIDRLKAILGLDKLKRIEGYDISNIGGNYSVASMVVFENGEPAAKEYRKFKIKTVTGSDDFASMHETLSRRLSDMLNSKEKFCKCPDLILIDGGFGQLHAAAEVIASKGLQIPIISLAKRDEEICTLTSNIPIKLEKADYALRLLQRVRDEAHRFAITFHRDLRSKGIESELRQIEGLGRQKTNELIKYFKSVESIRQASREELVKVKGIGEALAEQIYSYFHG